VKLKGLKVGILITILVISPLIAQALSNIKHWISNDDENNIGVVVAFKKLENNNVTENVSVIYPIRVRLLNGSVLSYSTIDEAVSTIFKLITENRIALSDISNISVLLFQDYMRLVNQNVTSVNGTYYIPAYRIFFGSLAHPEQYNYAGKIVAVNEDEFFYGSYGGRITKTFLYGKVPQLEIITLDNETLKISGNEILLLTYLNLSEEYITYNELCELNKTAEYFSSSGYGDQVKIVVIDISNSTNASLSLIGEFPKLIFVNDANTSISPNITGTYTEFGFTRYPAFVYMRGDFLVWRKAIGVESTSVISGYINGLLKLGDRGIFSYVVGNIQAWNLIETKKARVSIYICDGFGNVTVILSYEILDAENGTMESDSIMRNITEPTLLSYEIDLPNNSYKLKIHVMVVRNEVSEFSLTTIYDIEQLEEEKVGEEFPWMQVAMVMVALVIVVVLGYYAYRKTVPKTKQRKRR